jgi:predicted RNA-binding protein with PIN domain
MIGYDPEKDAENPSGSVFCANGAGFYVSWDKVKDHMHVDSYFRRAATEDADEGEDGAGILPMPEKWISPDEVDRILAKTSFANRGKRSPWKKRGKTYGNHEGPSSRGQNPPPGEQAAEATAGDVPVAGENRTGVAGKEERKEYLLVDGYNIIFAWPELKEIAKDSMDSARTRLLDLLSKYQGMRKCRVIAVFDAYRVQRRNEDVFDYGDVRVVFTREAQTADGYIEKFAHDNRKKYDITVATSDNLQQIIILGAGCSVISAGELKKDIARLDERISRALKDGQLLHRNYIREFLTDEVKEKMEEGAGKGDGQGS